MAHSVSEVQNGMTVVRVLNTTEIDIELLPGQHLGEFRSTSSSDSTIVEERCCTTSTVHSDAVPPVQIDEANLSHSQAQSLKMLLKKYSTVFSMHSEDRGCTGIIEHRIRMGNATPIKQRAYRVTPEQRAEIQNRVDELLKADIIEESYSPWAAPVILVHKKDGTWRFCLDYRKLNAVTIKDSHPLPKVDDTLDALSGSAWFSTMDLQHGYWQVEVEEQDWEKTAFTTSSGLYHFKVLPMGLTNAPATFQRLMEMVLHGLPWKTCLVYLEDVLIFSRSLSDHLQHLAEVFSRFRATGLKLNPAKCCLAKDHVQFLGHVVSKDSIQPDPRNKTRTSPYHPQGDGGMVKRFNRTLIDQLAKSLLQQPGEWDDCLNQVALAYNTYTHARTGFSPYLHTHGREARMPANLLLPNNIPSTSTPGSPADYAAQLTSKLQLAFLVWLNDPTTAKHKLAPHWKGPFEILECLGSDDDSPGVKYRIRYLLNQSDKSKIVHYNRLKPYLSSVPVEGCDATALT
ncbi:hypothetical protein AOLI_G00229240 [Acnodon oligacanthus]